MMHIEFTERGFARAEFTDRYGSQCSIQESSLATEAAIWLGVDKDFEGREATRMHLTQEIAAELIPLLQRFVETGELQPSPPPDTAADAGADALAQLLSAAMMAREELVFGGDWKTAQAKLDAAIERARALEAGE